METTVDPEAAIEWLERMEVPVDAQKDIKTFQEWLTKELKPTEKQFTALTDAAMERFFGVFPEDVKAVKIEYPWGIEIRYGIPRTAWLHPEEYRSGLWSFEKMKEITGWGA